MLFSRGARLGTYEILDFVGSGGMGEVYLARDSRLQREVAVKVVGRDQVSDPAMHARLLEEARLASTLNHPNICTIHEVGELEDLTYVVMERVEGHTLKDRIGKDGLPAEVVLRYGKQVAEALAHAHERGIIHRDLKSANVMITHEGRVKILDFGLAERVERVDSDRTPSRGSLTGTGGVRGTPAYMSPELLRGEPADPRSDLWSLGVTLYEMASGRLPFTGETPFQLGTAILKDSPSPLPPDVSVALGRIIQHCLAKDPAHRYQRASELAAALEVTEVAGSTMSTGRIAGLAPEKPSTTVRVLAATGGLAFLALLSVALWTVFHPRRADVRLANALQLTTAVGVENYPSWRPDGTEIAYESSESGNWDVWIARVDGSERINRTADYEGNDRFPSWSPDGRQIAFWSDRDGGGYYLLSVLGGAVRAIPEVDLVGFPIDQLSPPQWSPDGKDLVVVASEDGATVVRKIDLSSGETRPFSLPGMAGNGRLNLSGSRDGRFLAYVDAVDLSAQVTQIRLFRPSDGQSFPVTDGMTSSWSPTWSPDGRFLYFVSNLGGVMDLKRMRVEEDGPRMDSLQSVTAGVGMLQAAVSPDGTRVAFAKGRVVANLWRVPVLPDRPATWQDARQLTFEETDIEQVDLAPDGRTLVFSSDRRGNLDLWAAPIEGGPLESITSDPAPDWAPRWSPEGERILFYSYRSGHRDIWVTPRDRPSATALTRGEAEDLYPVFSPDGSAIAFESSRSGNRDIWVMNLKSGDVYPLTTHPGFDILPAWSPDGKWIAFISNRDGLFRLYRASVEGGGVERLTDVSVGYARWSPDGGTIFFTGWAETAGDIWAVSPEGGSPRKVTTLRGRPGTLRFTALATDGDQLVFAWEQNVGDLWVMDLIENDN